MLNLPKIWRNFSVGTGHIGQQQNRYCTWVESINFTKAEKKNLKHIKPNLIRFNQVTKVNTFLFMLQIGDKLPLIPSAHNEENIQGFLSNRLRTCTFLFIWPGVQAEFKYSCELLISH